MTHINIFFVPGTIINKKFYQSYIKTIKNHCLILPKLHYNPQYTDYNRFSKKDIHILSSVLDNVTTTEKKTEFIMPGMCDEKYIIKTFLNKNGNKGKLNEDISKNHQFNAYKRKYYTKVSDYYIRNQTYRQFQNLFYTHATERTNTFNVIFNDFQSADTEKIKSQMHIDEKKLHVLEPIINRIKTIDSPMPIYRTDVFDSEIIENLSKTFDDLSFDRFICHQSRDKKPYLFDYLSRNNNQIIWYDLAQLSKSDEEIQVQAKMLAGIFLSNEISIFATNAFADKFLYNVYSVRNKLDVGNGICFELAMCKILNKEKFSIVHFDNVIEIEFSQLLDLVNLDEKIHIDFTPTVGEIIMMLKGANVTSCL